MATKREEMEKATRGEGCLGKAFDDEPLFILRGNDKLAPDMVRSWAAWADVHRCPSEKVAEARRLATAMEAWQQDNPHLAKWPD